MRAHPVTGLIAGMVLLVLGAQGGIRLLADHADAGLIGRLPGGFPVWLSCYGVLTLAGVLLAGWGSRGVKQAEDRDG
ncbi:hypothetical protein AB0F15_09575 [Amycolatopsis sp. NPDC026612]|uniref:hypothetical protein n=1 Tax=Amycolatopsis sp. NPDC026612 TaxID=3155466 RepID=UPI0033E42330